MVRFDGILSMQVAAISCLRAVSLLVFGILWCNGIVTWINCELDQV